MFLLDDRFMNDRQIAQLSSWVKPRVKKFTNFGTALNAFRTFITNAAQDKNLISKVGTFPSRSCFYSLCF